MRKLYFLFFMAFLPLVVSAQAMEIDGIYYNLNSSGDTKTAEVTQNPNKYFGDIVIPETITYNDVTYSVSSIGQQAFFYCSGLTSVTIPNSVTSIGYEAFFYCSSLISVTIPNSVNSIGRTAFLGTAWYDNQPDGLVYAGKVAYKYKGEMPVNTAIILESGTLGIAPHAFSGCSGMTSVTIPNSVTSIGFNAFSDCTSLTSVTIPNSVTSIVDWTFSGCSGLTSVTIPNSVTSIDNTAFYNCSGLTSVTIPNSVTSIGDLTFSGCSGLTSVTIPNSVISIGSNAFDNTAWYNNQPDGLIYAGKVAYTYKGEMPVNTAITLENGTLGIAKYAFFGCSGITSVIIPNSVSSIGDGVFSGCSKLTSIVVEDGNTVYDSRDNCNAIIETSTNTLISGCQNTKIPNSVVHIGSEAFLDCGGLKNIIIPEGVKTIGTNAFNLCSGLEGVELPSSLTNIGYGAFKICSKMKTVISHITNPGGVLSSDDVFDSSSATLLVPAGTLFRYYAISGWTKFDRMYEFTKVGDLNYVLEAIVKRASVISGNYKDLSSVTIPSKINIDGVDYDVVKIGSSAFKQCKNLKSISLPDGIKNIDDQAFYQTGITEVNLPSSLESIGASAFWNCNGLKTLTIPEGVKSIGSSAFRYCYYLQTLELPSSLEAISPYAFGSCTRLTNIISHIQEPFSIQKNVFDISTWNNGVETITPSPATLYVTQSSIDAYKATEGWSSFKNVLPLEDILANIEFADPKVKEICVANWDTNGDGELSKLEALEVSDIGERFYGNKDITSFDELKYFKGLTSIPERAFHSCNKLESIVIPNTVTKIDFVAFYGCALTSITIPESVTNIDHGAFGNCHQLTTIVVDSRNPVFDSRDDCNAVIKTSTNTMVIGCKNTTFPNSVTTIGNSAFAFSYLTSIAIPDGITTIEEWAFYSCDYLKSVIIPKSVTNVFGTSFGSCWNLTSIIVEADNPKYDSRDNCNAIIETATNTLVAGCEATVIPSSVPIIGKNSFNQRYFETFTIPGTVKTIEEDAFHNCISLKSVTISEGVEIIGGTAFNMCYNLGSVDPR